MGITLFIGVMKVQYRWGEKNENITDESVKLLAGNISQLQALAHLNLNFARLNYS